MKNQGDKTLISMFFLKAQGVCGTLNRTLRLIMSSQDKQTASQLLTSRTVKLPRPLYPSRPFEYHNVLLGFALS